MDQQKAYTLNSVIHKGEREISEIAVGNKGDCCMDKGPIIDALLTEYKNIHQRVFNQVAQYEQTNVKILMLVGVLVFFGLSNYSSKDSTITLYVDCTFIIALPLIAISMVLLSLADLVKVMILGDYLKIIENKVNTVLGEEAKTFQIEKQKVLNWEWWRIEHGHVRKGLGASSEISFSLIIVILVIILSVFSSIIRLKYIRNTMYDSNPGYYCMFFLLYGILVLVFVGVGICSIRIFKDRRNKTREHVKIEKTETLCFCDDSGNE